MVGTVHSTKTKSDHIQAAKTNWRENCKFGIEVPNQIKQAYKIDEETHTDFWIKSIAKEKLKVKIAYVENEATLEQVRSGEAPWFVGFQEITCHLIFDVKMDFSRKCWMVANGSTAEAPSSLT